jgi:hypothetical protein
VISEVERFDVADGQELVLGNRLQDGDVSLTQPARQLINVPWMHALLAARLPGCGARMGTIIKRP